jgi:DNA replication licensing factor MCM5
MHAGEGMAKLSDNDRHEKFLKRYLQYARSHCFPRLSVGAAAHLQSEYVSIRKQVRPPSKTAG